MVHVVSVLGEEVRIRISERVSRKELSPDPSPYSFLQRRRFEFIPSGRLSLLLIDAAHNAPRKTWSDGKIQRLEGCLNAFSVGIVAAAVAERTNRLKREELQREWEEQERIRLERERLNRIEQRREAYVLDLATRVNRTEEVRRLLQVLSERYEHSDGLGLEAEAAGMVTWMTDYVSRTDPAADVMGVIEGFPSVEV